MYRESQETTTQYSFEALTKNEWSYEDFKSFLVTAETKLPLSEKRMPKSIDTGALGNELESLIRETKSDHLHRERGKVIKLGLDQRVMIQTNATVGNDNHVNLTASFKKEVYNRKPWYSKTEKCLGSMHTHPTDMPPSFIDLTRLITEQDGGGTVFEMIATPRIKLLFIRTMETEGLTENESNSWENEMVKKYTEEVRNRASGTSEALINNKLVAETCKEHHVAVYASIGGNSFTRADLS